MDDSPSTNPSPSGDPQKETDSSLVRPPDLRAAPDFLRRRIAILFVSGLAAFSLTAWFLVHLDVAKETPNDASTAEGVVRAQLDALAQGELSIAYSLFTPRYRNEVPFESFEHLVEMHGAMFRARDLHVEYKVENLAHADLRVRLEAKDGEHYIANYTAIVIEGRWWIDEPPRDRVLAREAGDAAARDREPS
ncbi:MAG: DUF4864 domain-containing protein [Candidatus Acidiferrales bacterium]